MFGIQPIHLIVILIVALIIFGPSRLPEIGRGLGKAITEFRRGTHEMTDSLREEMNKGLTGETLNGAVMNAQPAADAHGGGHTCPNCGASNPSESHFCMQCGAQLSHD